MMNSGVTVLFVSHDIGSVKSLCQRCAFLEKGELVKFAKTPEVIATYMSIVHGEINQELKKIVAVNIKNIEPNIHSREEKLEQEESLNNYSHISEIFVSTKEESKFAEGYNRYGDGGAKILDIKLLNSQHQPTNELDFKEDFIIQVSILFEQDFLSFCVGYSLRDLKGQMLIGTVTTAEKIQMPSVKAEEVYIIGIKGQNVLNCGVYTITIGIELPVVINQQHIFLDILENALVFKSNPPVDKREHIPCMVYIPVKFDILNFSDSQNSSIKEN
jgi:hypothetical protein